MKNKKIITASGILLVVLGVTLGLIATIIPTGTDYNGIIMAYDNAIVKYEVVGCNCDKQQFEELLKTMPLRTIENLPKAPTTISTCRYTSIQANELVWDDISNIELKNNALIYLGLTQNIENRDLVILYSEFLREKRLGNQFIRWLQESVVDSSDDKTLDTYIRTYTIFHDN